MDPEAPELDLDAIGRDLADVEIALRRLDEGTYRTDERTGEELPEELLANRPAARWTDEVPTTPPPS